MSSTYNDIPKGLRVPTQIPLDVKTWASVKSAISTLGTDNNLAYTYFDNLRIYCADTKETFVWREKVAPEPLAGLITPDFVYPSGTIANGKDYSGKTYNLYPVVTLFAPGTGTNSITTVIGSNIASGVKSFATGDTTTASGIASRSTGFGSLASGNYSSAEGQTTIASGVGAHAEGNSGQASGDASHVEGNNTRATASSSHAEGLGSHANGLGSHAEGSFTTASNSSDHAEGNSTTASGGPSHAEGYGTTASGFASHAGGFNTVASKPVEWARSGDGDRGQYGIVDYITSTSDATITEMTIADIPSEYLTIPLNGGYRYNVQLICSNGTNFKEWSGSGLIKNAGGTTSIIGSSLVSTYGDATLSAATTTITADNTNDRLAFKVTGIIGQNLNWYAKLDYVKLP